MDQKTIQVSILETLVYLQCYSSSYCFHLGIPQWVTNMLTYAIDFHALISAEIFNFTIITFYTRLF